MSNIKPVAKEFEHVMLSAYRQNAARTFSFWPWLTRPVVKRENMRAIAARVAQEEGVRVEDLKGGRQGRQYAYPRHRFMAEARDNNFSVTQIGRFLGCNPSTVSTGSRGHKKRERAQISCAKHTLSQAEQTANGDTFA